MKLSFRIALLVTMFAIAFAGAITVTLGYFGGQRVEEEDRRWARLLTEALSDTLARNVIDGDLVHAQGVLLGIIGKSDEIRYMYIEGFDGEIVAHTFGGGFPQRLRELTVEPGDPEARLLRLSDGSHILEFSEPIIEGMPARLHIGINHQIAENAVWDVARQVALLLVAFVALGALVGIIAGKKISASIENVAQKMFAFGQEGAFTPFTKRPAGAEELMLVSAFEKMAEGRNKADHAVRMREKALNDAQRIAHLGNWDWNIETGDLWWSDEIYRIFGLKKDEFEASYDAFLETVHPDDRERVASAVDHSVANKTPYIVRHRIVLPDGTERIVREQGELYVSEGTGHRHMSGIVHDITELEEAFADLRHKEAVLAEAQRLAKTGHWESKADRSATYWSDQLYAILGHSVDEAPLPREVFAEHVHPDDRARFLKLVELPAETEWPANSEFRIVVGGDIKNIRINRRLRYADDGSVDRIIGTVQDVTELDHVLKELRRNETLLAQAQEMAKIGHWESDANLKNVYCSDELYRIFEADPKDFKPSREAFAAFLHPDDMQGFVDMVAGMPEFGMPPNSEFRVIVDGKVKFIRLNREEHSREDGSVERVMGTVQDVTAAKGLENALREREQRLAWAQEIAHVGNFEWNPIKDDLWWSDEAYRIFGFEPQVTEIDYPVFMESIHPDDRAFVADKIARMLEGEPYDIEHRIVLPDGSIRTVNEQGVVEWDEDGNPLIVRGVMFDITERRAAFAASEKLGHIIEDSTSEIYVFDMESLLFTSVNRGARDNLGYNMGELTTMTPVDIKPEYTLDDFLQAIQPLKDGHQRDIRFETVHQRKDGSSYDVEVRLQLTRKGDRPAFFASVIDITDRLKAAESARQLRRQLAHAARLSTVGGMATGLAHEINQPLSAISNYAQVCIRLMENGKGTKEEIVEDMRKISQQVERAAEIIKWLRKTVRREAVDKAALDMNGCIKEVIDLMGAEFRARKSQIRFELSDELPSIVANKVQIQQVLVNLIQNSLNAAHPNRKHSLVIKTGSADGGMIEIDVEDNGPGVPADIQDEIFAPFFSTRGEGLGFGLAVSRSIIEAHGGKLWLDPEFPKGAAFRFSVPVQDGGVA